MCGVVILEDIKSSAVQRLQYGKELKSQYVSYLYAWSYCQPFRLVLKTPRIATGLLHPRTCAGISDDVVSVAVVYRVVAPLFASHIKTQATRCATLHHITWLIGSVCVMACVMAFVHTFFGFMCCVV